ncbi:NUDIX hydrolase [Sphaerimonospora mesophila]|uniref:NUDIX hydrolase n=1 Tax=Sphaerimonospora mesophila TaxID=37483 RepID=UPI000A46DFEE
MMTADGRHSVSVAGVIVDDRGRVLLTQRADNDQWQAPGGVLELNEGITDGLRREVSEETGLTVEPVALTGVYKNMTRGIVALVFRCRPTGGQLTINDEVQRFHWATPDEVRQMVTEAFAVRVLDALHEGAPAIRQHDGVHLV